jgi:hypothetical protein
MRSLPLVALFLAAGCRQTLESPAAPAQNALKQWEALLGRIVDERGLVDYDTLESERGALDQYVAWLADERAWQGRTTKDWHAQYLNAYNALVLFQVLERGRPESVRDVQGIVPIPGFKFFHGTQFRLGVDSLTLSEIENERLRWKEMDYRDHAAMNCAAMSCPPLRPELYRPQGIGSQLDRQMRAWMSDEERSVKIVDGQAVFNPIFDWYARDFSFFSAGIDPCTIAATYIDDDARREALYALAGEGCPRTYFAYDWSLNDAN